MAPVSGFQAMIAFARAPPADVPTLRMSRIAWPSWPPDSDVLSCFRSDSTWEASVTSAAIWMSPDGDAAGPRAGSHSNAPVPRRPV